MNPVVRIVVSVSSGLDRVCLLFAKAALVGMVGVIAIQVVARYGLNAPPGWTEELARYLMVWGGLLGATAAFRRAADPAVVTSPETGRSLFTIASKVAITAGVIIFIAPILYYSFFGPGFDPGRSFLMRNFARTSSGLGLNLLAVAAAIPTFCTVILIHLAARMIAGPARTQVSPHAADIV